MDKAGIITDICKAHSIGSPLIFSIKCFGVPLSDILEKGKRRFHDKDFIKDIAKVKNGLGFQNSVINQSNQKRLFEQRIAGLGSSLI